MLEETRQPRLTLEPLDDYIVIAVGQEPGGVEPGDKVLFPRGAGFDVRLAGTAAKVMRRGDLIARVHD